MSENASRAIEPRGRSVYVWLPGWQWEALRTLAEIEHRPAKDQAAYLIEQGLRRATVEIDMADGAPAGADRP